MRPDLVLAAEAAAHKRGKHSNPFGRYPQSRCDVDLSVVHALCRVIKHDRSIAPIRHGRPGLHRMMMFDGCVEPCADRVRSLDGIAGCADRDLHLLAEENRRLRRVAVVQIEGYRNGIVFDRDGCCRFLSRKQACGYDDRDDLAGEMDVGTGHREPATETEAVEIGQRAAEQFNAGVLVRKDR